MASESVEQCRFGLATGGLNRRFFPVGEPSWLLLNRLLVVSARWKGGMLCRMSMPPGGIPDPPDEPTEFQNAVVAVVSALQPGDVVTYAEVAAEAGHPGAAQAVANVLRVVPDLPWWRVIPSSGRLYRTHRPTQEPRLRADGVAIDGNGNVITGTDRGGCATPG
jgi:methylated-DNA-protein-cysteine methyltransferase-like protein